MEEQLMHISAKIPGELAVGEEKERIHQSGSDIGCVFIMNYYETIHLVEQDEHGNNDFTKAYQETLRQFLESDVRIREGHAFEIRII